MFEIVAASILGLYLLGNQGGNDSVGNQAATLAAWTLLASLARRVLR